MSSVRVDMSLGQKVGGEPQCILPAHTLPQKRAKSRPCQMLSRFGKNCNLGKLIIFQLVLGLLLADGTPTGGRGEDFLSRQPDFFTETAVTPERKVEKSFPRWEINRHVEG